MQHVEIDPQYPLEKKGKNLRNNVSFLTINVCFWKHTTILKNLKESTKSIKKKCYLMTNVNDDDFFIANFSSLKLAQCILQTQNKGKYSNISI